MKLPSSMVGRVESISLGWTNGLYNVHNVSPRQASREALGGPLNLAGTW